MRSPRADLVRHVRATMHAAEWAREQRGISVEARDHLSHAVDHLSHALANLEAEVTEYEWSDMVVPVSPTMDPLE